MRKRLLVAAACAAVAMLLGWFYLRGAELRATGGRLVQVLVAARELQPPARISEADLAVREIPEAYVHPEAVLANAADEKKLLGRPLATRLTQGQMILWSDLESSKAKIARRLAGAVQKGQRAITIAVDPTSSFGNQIRATDRVDVLYTYSRPNSEGTVTILQNVLVLSVTGKKEDQLVDGEPQMTITHVTLSLDLDESEILAFAAQHGVIQLVLHGDDDIDVVTDVRQKTFGDLIDDQKRSTLAARRTRKKPEALAADKVD